jgi:hypothetical protein
MGKIEKMIVLFNISLLQVSIVDDKQAKIVIHKATDHYPNEPSLWNKRLSLLIEESVNSKTIKKEFKLACQNSKIKVKHFFRPTS